MHDFQRQVGARLKLVDHDAFDTQRGVVVGADFGDVIEQRIQRAAREVVAIERDQAAIGSDQRGTRVKVQRGRRVDPDFVVAFERVQRLFQLVNFVARLELALQFFKPAVRRQHGKIFETRGSDEILGGLGPQFEAQHLLEKSAAG